MKIYTDKQLQKIAFSLGGLGAGNIAVKGTGAIGNIGVRHNAGIRNDPCLFSALTVLGETNISRVLEAPVPDDVIDSKYINSGLGLAYTSFGLPHFTNGSFSSRYPFAHVHLTDEYMPVDVNLRAWSPFVAGEEDFSSLPYAALEYTFENRTNKALDCIYYFCAENFMKVNDSADVRAVENGFVLEQPGDPADCAVAGAFAAQADCPAGVDVAWFRGGWWDSLSMLWNNIAAGEHGDKVYEPGCPLHSKGATLNVPLHIAPYGKQAVTVRLSWYVPGSHMRYGIDEPGDPAKAEDFFQPWYSAQFAGIDEEIADWKSRYSMLLDLSEKFSDCFYDTDIPEEITEAVAANLSNLKSHTVLRLRDGRLWGFEGSEDYNGSCPGTTTHVWNYQQAVCHLFPRLERSLRDTEFFDNQNAEGHQDFHTTMPVQTPRHNFYAASDGQLGGMAKVYREWRISGDTEWLKKVWPKVRESLDYCIREWDPDHEGVLKKPHHNTYDIEFWGADGMCTGYYLSALKAACLMGEALGEDVSLYAQLYKDGRAYMEDKLFNGSYFYQQVEWNNVEEVIENSNGIFVGTYSPELIKLVKKEGPRYQYGTGCLSDAVVGIWLGEMCGLTDIVDEEKLQKTLRSIFRYNFRADLSSHANPQRPGYALNKEGGLLLCSWPFGNMPSLPFVYSNEVWTGIEYQVAAHLLSKGMVQEALTIVRTLRARFDGTKRNPYCEYECGYWYTRAMASYGMLSAYTGVRYDAIDKTLHLSTRNADSFRCFLSTETGFGTVTVKDGKASFTPVYGAVDIQNTVFDA